MVSTEWKGKFISKIGDLNWPSKTTKLFMELRVYNIIFTINFLVSFLE